MEIPPHFPAGNDHQAEFDDIPPPPAGPPVLARQNAVILPFRIPSALLDSSFFTEHVHFDKKQSG